MKVYVVIGFKKDKETGYSLPCSLDVYSTREAAEQAADHMNVFTTVTTKEVRK